MNTKPIENQEVSLKELIEKVKDWYIFLLSKWKVIFLAGFIGAILGITYSLIKKPIYTATLSFAVEDKSSGGGFGAALGLVSSLGLDISGGGGSVFSGSNLTELFKSRSMVEQTLLTSIPVSAPNNVSLAEMYIQNCGWRNDWEKKSNLSSIQFLPNSDRTKCTRVHDSILGVIYRNLSDNSLKVEQKDKKIPIITIEMSSNDELFAKYFTEALAKRVSDFYINTKSKNARANMEILQKQTDSIRSELNGAITGVAVANDNTFNLNPALNVRRTPSAKRQVDVQANTAILTELVKQSELAKVTLRKETPLIQIIDRPILPLQKERFGKLKGIVIGGFFGVFFILIFLAIKRLLASL